MNCKRVGKSPEDKFWLRYLFRAYSITSEEEGGRLPNNYMEGQGRNPLISALQICISKTPSQLKSPTSVMDTSQVGAVLRGVVCLNHVHNNITQIYNLALGEIVCYKVHL